MRVCLHTHTHTHTHARVGGNSIAKKRGDDLFDLIDEVAKQPATNTIVKKDKACYMCVHVCMFIYVRTYIRAYICVCVCMFIYVRTYIRAYICINTCVYIYI